MTWCGIGSGGGTAFCLDDDPTDNCTPYQQYCSQGLEAQGQGQGLEVEDSRLEDKDKGTRFKNSFLPFSISNYQ